MRPDLHRAPSVHRPRRAFALLVTIVLVAFLVLVLVGLATFTRVETQVATNTQSIAQARQNALLALNIAVGQLQRHTGPDQRVTAPADASIPSGVTVTASTSATSAIADIDTYWRASRNRRWTGAWRNANLDPAGYDASNPANFNSAPVLQSWLVSGNENSATGDAYRPTDQLAGLSASGTALDEFLDASGRPHRILLKAPARVVDAGDLDRIVTAPQIALTTDGVPGASGAHTVGHYAWWVGDEGVKARANLLDPYLNDGTTSSNITRVQSAQRPAVEIMSANFSALDPLANNSNSSAYAAFTERLERVIARDQLAYLDTSPGFSDDLGERYHDITLLSRGVLSDAKNGGLKADLTYLFARPDLGDFRTALRALYDTTAIAPINANAGDLSANPIINDVAAFRASLPSIAPDGGNYTGKFINTATWEQLWSFANQGASFDSAGRALPRNHSATQHGAYPLVIQTKMFFRLRLVGGVADADGVNRTGTLSIDIIPVVLLANPYAVPLAPADYQLRISGSTPQLVFGSTDSTANPDVDFATRAYAAEPTYAGNITFVLRSTGMAPGEAQIFTIDPSPSANPTIDAEDRVVVASSTDAKEVVMKNEYDPSPALTFNTDKTIPAAPITRAALRLSNNALITRLYIGYVAAQGERRLVQRVNSQGYRDAAFSGSSLYSLVVDPMADDIRQGGGVIAVLNQPPTTDNRAAAPGRASQLFSQQQAVFSQVNYRSLSVDWNAPNSAVSHPLEWSRRFVKNGSTGSAGSTPNPWLGANLMRPSGSTTTARWGLVNIGEGGDQSTPPASIGGASAPDVGFANLLYDLPRPDHPLASLGQLQHFNPAGYVPDTSIQSISGINAWQNNYPVSNSYPQARVPRDRIFNYANNANVSLGYHFDGSYVWNDILWDRFFFSTYPQTGSFDFAPSSDRLANSRHRPFRSRAVVAWDDETAFRGDGNAANAANSRRAAQNLLLDGAFNVNSTSVEAWKALFSSLRHVPVGSVSTPSAPFTRSLSPSGGSSGSATGTSPDAWSGFRDLSSAEVQSLAEEMVMQVRKRGPFTSLSEFVNRRLVAAGSDTFGLGLSGALQAALDAVVNPVAGLSPEFAVKSSAVSSTSSTNAAHIAFAETGYIMPAGLNSFPGYMLQADVLSALGQTISVRSDTFVIRTYGDSANPATGTIGGRAWCEAVVQRLPDYVDTATPAGDLPATGSTNEKFGRRYQIISFRWLGPDDV